MIAQNVPHCVCQKSDPATSIEDSMRRATQREIPGALYGAEQIARRAMRAGHGRLGLSAAQTDPLRHFNIGQGDRLDRHDEPSSPTIACCILRLPVLAPAASKIRIATMTRFALSTVIAFVFVALAPELPAIATGDLFQQAVNYVFTGRLDPSDGPQIVDRDSCIVVVPEPKFNRYARYYLSRFKMDIARIGKIYAGAQPLYELEVEGDDIIFEYLKADRTTVDYGFTSAHIPLPGEIV